MTATTNGESTSRTVQSRKAPMASTTPMTARRAPALSGQGDTTSGASGEGLRVTKWSASLTVASHLVETPGGYVEHLVEVGALGDERRGKGDVFVAAPGDEAPLPSHRLESLTGPGGFGEALGVELKPLQETGATHVGDDVGILTPERVQPGAEVGALTASTGYQAAGLDLVDRGAADGGGDGIGAERVTVVELLALGGIGEERVPHMTGDDDGREGGVAAAHALAAAQEIGSDTVVVSPEPLA